MQQEIDSIHKNHTWDLVDLPTGKKPIGTKWVFKVKRKQDGSVDRYKARLVAKVYAQRKGIDYDETFAPTSRASTVKSLVAIVAHHGWKVHQLDIKIAFLNGNLQEEVYVSQLSGFVVKGQEQKRQSISRIKILDGSWTSSKLQLSQECVRHYAILFAALAPLSTLESYARLQFLVVDEATALEQPFTDEELYHALKALRKGKAPGWDGLTAEFFHAFWKELKDALMLMISSAWLEQQLPSSWKQGLLKLLPKKHLAKNFDDWRPITLMPVVYKLVAKMLVHRVREILHRGLHPHQYGFIPRRHIVDNIVNAMIAIEYAKYSSQDVLVLQVDIAKAFDSVRWNFISQIMSRLGFGPRWINVIYRLYSEATTHAIFADGLSDPWELGRSVRQGSPLSALVYEISAHPLLLYVDKMVDTSLLHGVQIPGNPSFLPQAYADDSFFMPKNDHADLQALMKILSDFGLAVGLQISFKKSILLPLNYCDWHSVLWPGQLLSPHDVIRHLGYPIGWFITAKQQMEWVTVKLTQKLRYWKLSTWPLHVRLQIVQSIVMAHVQFYLPLLS
ncbi:hypothetical protein L7F22_035466 [Adiantum nelumboides]|nr:hypothetical protein [Adiantum nelumboides]